MSDPQFEQLSAFAGQVSRETFEDLKRFETTFIRWAQRINLVSPSTLPEIWSRHILDSAQLAPLAREARTWVDIGSGGGFPGLVLAFLLKERPGAVIHLVESNRKKAGFLQAMVGEFALPAHIHAVRIEAAPRITGATDVVTARALAPLPALLELSAPWLSRGAIGLFHKGRDYRTEVQESGNRWAFDLVEHRSKVGPEGVVLEISGLRQA